MLAPVRGSATGEVQLHKVVHEKEQQVPVISATRKFPIDRRAVDRPLAPGEITDDLKDEVIRVPIYRGASRTSEASPSAQEVGNLARRQCRSSKLFRAPRAMSTWRSNNKETLTSGAMRGDANYNTTDDTDRANP